MPRLTDYICDECGSTEEVLYGDSEERILILETKCPDCGGDMRKHDWKANTHRWSHNDRGGL